MKRIGTEKGVSACESSLTQVVTLSVIDIETQKEVERRIIESPVSFIKS